jgi:threonine/homoserine/homoserine lactone efflux protein
MSDILPSSVALAGFAAAVIVLTLVPGPDMMLYLSKTITQSRRAGIATLAGALSGLLVHTALAAVGLTALLAASATAFTILKVAGAAYLLWLAWDAIQNGSSFSLAPGAGAERLHRLYFKGMLVNLLNPKVIVFFLTFLPQFVTVGDPDAPAQLVVLGIGFVVIALPICIAQILAASALARLLRRSPKVTRAVDFLFAGVMAAFAARLVFSQGK